jgi:hypothetical protein
MVGGVLVPPPSSVPSPEPPRCQSPLGIQLAPCVASPGSHGMHVVPPGIHPPVGEKPRCDVFDGEGGAFEVGGCSTTPVVVDEVLLDGDTEGGWVLMTGCGGDFGPIGLPSLSDW